MRVDAAGLVTTVNGGSATITATADDPEVTTDLDQVSLELHAFF